MKTRILILLLLSVAVLATGCDSPTDPGTVILTSARVIGGVGQIAFEDTSTTIPADKAAVVEVVVRLPTGNTADAATVAPGGEVTFTGLAEGIYTVEQTVYLKDGTKGATKVHNNVVVT